MSGSRYVSMDEDIKAITINADSESDCSSTAIVDRCSTITKSQNLFHSPSDCNTVNSTENSKYLVSPGSCIKSREQSSKQITPSQTSVTESMSHKYYMLVSFLCNICKELMRDIFLHLAKTDSLEREISFTNFESYLHYRKSHIMILKRTGKLRNDQYKRVLTSFEKADLTQWDVSLWTILILNLFESQLGLEEKNSFLEIRQVRYYLVHIPGYDKITNDIFNEYWDRLQKATLSLAREIKGNESFYKVRAQIDDIKNEKLPESADIWRGWFEETVTQLRDEFESLGAKMAEKKHDIDYAKYRVGDGATSMRLNRKETVRPGVSSREKQALLQEETRTEHSVKKMKTMDQEIHRIKGEFKRTMDSFSSRSKTFHPDVLPIQHILDKSHHVVLTGTDNCRVIETACYAINHRQYDPARCVEIWRLGDWHCIDTDQVDLVLFRDPFDETKEKSLSDLFTKVLHATKDNLLDFMIICDANDLAKFKEKYNHDLLNEVVMISQSAVEHLPPDDKKGPLETVTCEEAQSVIGDTQLPDEQKDSDSGHPLDDRKSTFPDDNIMEVVTKLEGSQFETSNGQLSDRHTLSDDDQHLGDRKSPWQNVETVEDAKALINDGLLPDEHGLSDLVLHVGMKSEIVELVCQQICRKIVSVSPNVVHVFAAYTLGDKEKLHFVVFLEKDTISDLNLEYQIVFRSCQKDEQTEPKHIQAESEGELSVQESIALKNTINSISKQYMENHRYLSAITARKIISEGVEKLSIIMYVHSCTDRYSSIPHKEEPLPKEIQGYEVVVRNGVFKTATKTADDYHEHLRMGCKITSNLVNGFGTLGGFIDHHEYGLCGFTCAHVVYGTEQMALLKRKKRYKWSPTEDPSKGDPVPCFVYQPSTDSVPVGRVVEAIYTEGGDSDSAGVDLALFQIENRPPVTGSFPRCSSNNKLKYASGTTWGRSRLKPEKCEIQKFGVATGITHGKVKFDGMIVRELRFISKGFIDSVDSILYNQYEIDNDTLNICEQGDSGGLVFMIDCTDKLNCIGMVNGVLDTITPLHGVVTPITDILREMNVKRLMPFRKALTLDLLEIKLRQNSEAAQKQQRTGNTELLSQIRADLNFIQPYINERVSALGKDIHTNVMESVQMTIRNEFQSSMNTVQSYIDESISNRMEGVQKTITNEVKSALLQNQTAEQTNQT